MWLTHSALFDIVNHLKLSHPLVSITTSTWFFSLSIWSLSASQVTAPPVPGLCGCSPVFHFGGTSYFTYLLLTYTSYSVYYLWEISSSSPSFNSHLLTILKTVFVIPTFYYTSDYYFQLLGITYWASLVAQMVTLPPEMWETWVWLLNWEDSLKEGMAIHSSTFAWRIPMSRGAWWATQRSGHDWAAKHKHTQYNLLVYSSDISICLTLNSSFSPSLPYLHPNMDSPTPTCSIHFHKLETLKSSCFCCPSTMHSSSSSSPWILSIQYLKSFSHPTFSPVPSSAVLVQFLVFSHLFGFPDISPSLL